MPYAEPSPKEEEHLEMSHRRGINRQGWGARGWEGGSPSRRGARLAPPPEAGELGPPSRIRGEKSQHLGAPQALQSTGPSLCAWACQPSRQGPHHLLTDRNAEAREGRTPHPTVASSGTEE